MGERVCPGKPHKVLLGYTRCLASIARVALAASGCGEQQGHSSLRGLLAPTVRWGCRGWADASGLGEGSGLEISPESSQGGRGKARWGQVGHSRLCAGGGGTVGSNTEPEESGGRSSASFPCSFVKPLCQSLRQVPQKETSDPSTPVASLKGLRWKTEPLQAQPMSSLGMNPIRALAPTDFKEPLPSGVVALLWTKVIGQGP